VLVGPLLFVMHINDLMYGLIKKFADDANIVRVVNSEEDSRSLQEDINGLVRWAEQWQMELNPEKFAVMN